jgi:Rieske Fe-S protein
LKQSCEAFPVAVARERSLDRRRFLRAAGAAAAAVVCGEWTARALTSHPARTLEVRLDPHLPLAAGSSRALLDPAGGEALVVRLDASTVVAFDRRCPHLGCPVLWSAERGRFECPCHKAAFDARTGEVLSGPPRRGLNPANLRIA